jgi:hypothetical protein
MNQGENWREPQNTLLLARNGTKSGANGYSRIFSPFRCFLLGHNTLKENRLDC